MHCLCYHSPGPERFKHYTWLRTCWSPFCTALAGQAYLDPAYVVLLTVPPAGLAAKCRQREQKERLEALRGNNVEEYMRLVAGQGGRRNARLDTLLSQAGAASWVAGQSGCGIQEAA